MLPSLAFLSLSYGPPLGFMIYTHVYIHVYKYVSMYFKADI